MFDFFEIFFLTFENVLDFSYLDLQNIFEQNFDEFLFWALLHIKNILLWFLHLIYKGINIVCEFALVLLKNFFAWNTSDKNVPNVHTYTIIMYNSKIYIYINIYLIKRKSLEGPTPFWKTVLV